MFTPFVVMFSYLYTCLPHYLRCSVTFIHVYSIICDVQLPLYMFTPLFVIFSYLYTCLPHYL